MPFTPRNRQTIRTSLLTNLQARYAALNPPQQVLTIPGSDAYMMADALAVEQELLEQQALFTTANIFPDTADATNLQHHATVQDVPQIAAVPWSGDIQVSGTPSATLTFGSATLIYNGISYGAFADDSTDASIASITLDGSGRATVRATATVSGAVTNLVDETVLAWSSPPTSANSTAVVALDGTVVEGADAEQNPLWASRIIARLQERPASGDRADFADWVEQCDGVQDAFVYPLAQYNTGGSTLITGARGLVTVIPATAPIGDVPNSTGRTLSQAACDTIALFIEGKYDQHGVATTSGTQLRPVTLYNSVTTPGGGQGGSNYVIFPGLTNSFAPVVQVTVSATGPYVPLWNPEGSGQYLILNYAFTSNAGDAFGEMTLNLSTAHDIPIGAIVAVSCTVASKRGGFYAATVTDGNQGAGTLKFANWAASETANTPLYIPVVSVSDVIWPACPNWASIQVAVFDYFDALGPGDINTAIGQNPASARYPTQDVKGRARISNSSIEAAILDAFPGALSVFAFGFSDTTLPPMTFAVLSIVTVTFITI